MERLIRSIGANRGDAALDKNPKVKKPASEKDVASSVGVNAPSSEVEERTAKPRIREAKSAKDVREATAGNDGINSPRLVHRNGVAYVDGCDAPVWRLEMARRAGSAPATLTAAFPGLTSSGMDLAFAYARQHRAKLDKLIRRQGPAAVPASDEGADDAAEFEAELASLLDKNAEVFRRLAQ